MKLISLLFLLLLGSLACTQNAPADSGVTKKQQSAQQSSIYQPNSARDLITHWKNHYADQSIRAFTFEQETIRFKDGQATDTALWYEAVQYPDQFRIDFGNGSEGNINLWRRDSVYVLREGEWKHRGPKVQESLILKGALYQLPVDTTLAKLTAVGIDTAIFRKAMLNERSMYVIGASTGDDTSPQMWVDAERRNVVKRTSRLTNGKTLAVVYDDFVQVDGYWVESWVEFLLDGTLIQTERYKNIQIRDELPQEIFDPNLFSNHFWY